MINKAALHNRFDFEIYDIKTGETEYAQAENIVLNRMWEYITYSGSNSQYFKYISVGTGTGTLAPTRTTMFSYLGSKSCTDVEIVYDTATTAHRTRKAIFAETDAIGVWTEVSINLASSGGSPVTHAMIKDSEGNPITINKTNTKIVTVYATVYASLTNASMFEGSDNALLTHVLGNAPPTETPYFKYSSMLTSAGSPSLLFAHTYIQGSWIRDVPNKRMYSTQRLLTTAGNSPIRGILVGLGLTELRLGYGAAALPLAGVFAKHDYTGVAVGTGDGETQQFDLPVSFPLANSEKIYVAGVEKIRGTDYTIHYGMKSNDTLIAQNINTTATYYSGEIEETIVLPQPSGGEATITSIKMQSAGSPYRANGYDVQLSLDGENWVTAGYLESGWSTAITTLDAFTPAAYKYARFKFVPSSTILRIALIEIYATPPATKHISFITPPAVGAAITADFSTDYINKTENFVVDVQAEMVFGEGV